MAKIAIACGGTGGHLFPGLAVAERLRAAGHQVRLYISEKEIDRRALAAHPDYEALALPTVGWPGIGPGVPRFLSRFAAAYRGSVAEIRGFAPDAVLGMGGFTCAPVLLAAALRRIPALLHESNAIPGKVTRWLAPWMSRVFLGFSECAAHLEAREMRVTGTPVRGNLRPLPRAEAAAWWGLDPARPTVVAMGGSQGAAGLNRMMTGAAVEWASRLPRIQIIHLTGPADEALTELNYRRAGVTAVVKPFCDRMEMAYSAADLVVARSGAASLTELGHFGLPSILVPYPHAAEDHQTRNAEVFVRRGAALLVPEVEGAAVRLAEEVGRLFADEARRVEMARRAAAIQEGDAAERVAREVENALF